jgi:hypothetical protein
MAKFFGNLHLVLLVGLVRRIAVMFQVRGSIVRRDPPMCCHWLHVFFGIVWIGLLYYLNFVQVPTMPAIPAEQKGAITGHIAPKVFFFFRYGALLTRADRPDASRSSRAMPPRADLPALRIRT